MANVSLRMANFSNLATLKKLWRGNLLPLLVCLVAGFKERFRVSLWLTVEPTMYEESTQMTWIMTSNFF